MTQQSIESKVSQVIKEELGEEVALKTIGKHSSYTPIKDLDLNTMKPWNSPVSEVVQEVSKDKTEGTGEDLYGLREIQIETEGADDLKNLNFDTLSQLEDFDETPLQFEEEKEQVIEEEVKIEDEFPELDEFEEEPSDKIEDEVEDVYNDGIKDFEEMELTEEVEEQISEVTPVEVVAQDDNHSNRGKSMQDALNKLEDEEVKNTVGLIRSPKKNEVAKIESYAVPALLEEAQETQSALVKQVLRYEDVPALVHSTSIVWEIKSKVEEIHPPVKLLIERIINAYIQILTQEGRIFITLDEADINAQLLKTHPNFIPSLEKIGFMVVDSADEPVIAVKSLTQLSEFFGKDFLSYRNEAKDKVFKDFLSEMETCISQGRRIAIPLTEEISLETFEGFKTYIPPRLTVEELKVFIVHTTSKYKFQHKVWNDHLFLWRSYNA